jgi:hypothetical protein
MMGKFMSNQEESGSVVAVKRPRGRQALPGALRQSEVIRERVTPGLFEAYTRMGGKMFITEVIERAYKDYQAGKRVKAVFVPLELIGVDCVAPSAQNPVQFDITHVVMAMGREQALLLQDGDEAVNALRECATAPEWVKQWAGPFELCVSDSVASYFSEE